MSSPPDIEKLDKELMAMFNGRCAIHLSHPAVAVHEIVPRSKRPKNWWDPSNRIPICHHSHYIIHKVGTQNRSAFLRHKRKFALKIIGKAGDVK